ncbi:MAG: sodium-dependent bicarbonate transport family permease [Sulfurovum sp.]|nr:MAG: sodium-dependent bicarbonate transport family permease [Sulfurovum sp.]
MDPIVMFFILGVVGTLLKINVKIPHAIYEFLSILLLVAIGLKGGVELAKQPIGGVIIEVMVVFMMGIILPLIAYPILKNLGKINRIDAAAIAAHYGSVSVGTYAVATSYLVATGVSYESHLPLFVVVLEVPAILVGIFLVRGLKSEQESEHKVQWGKLAHEIFLGKSVYLLMGALTIGYIAGPDKIHTGSEIFKAMFTGVLALFLLEMGVIAASQLSDVKKYGLFLIGFGTIFPLFSSVIGAVTGAMLGFSVGGTMIMATLAASASYIAVPAAFRMAVPEANPSISIAAALAITFPFNVTVGIFIYMWIAEQIVPIIGG